MNLQQWPMLLLVRIACAVGILATASCVPATMEAWNSSDIVKDCHECPELMVIPAGEFMMGSSAGEGDDDERPKHRVRIETPLAVGRYEVTFAEWDACSRAGGCTHHPDDWGWGRNDMPVVDVSFIDVQEYLRWLSKRAGKEYRLLSEAEWEYAARAGTDTTRYWGDDPADACDFGNVADLTAGEGLTEERDWGVHPCRDGYGFEPAPVGQFAPNGFGLHDMLGNVWEWVQDCWHADYDEAPEDGKAWIQGGNCEYRVTRGASWDHRPEYLRVAKRNSRIIDDRFDTLGFRVARTN